MEPRNSELRRNLLRSLSAAGLHEQSIQEAEALLRTIPGSVTGHFHLGDALLQLGRVEDSISPLQSALRIDPGNSQAQVSLGTAFLRLGRGADAIPHLEASLRSGGDERLLFQLSRAYQIAGRSDDARAALERRGKLLASGESTQPPREITAP